MSWLAIAFELLRNFPEIVKLIKDIMSQIKEAGVDVKVNEVVKDLRQLQTEVSVKKLEEITDDQKKALNDILNGRRH